MTQSGHGCILDVGPASRSATVQAALFTCTIFAGAVLLFWIQPLFTKMALPLLGGSPLVWNTAMVFFQAMLLAGYAYAHGLSRWLGARAQLVVHAAVLGAAALALPIGIGAGWQPGAGTAPAVWLMALLFASLGAPFFALAATAPLLQRWFSLGRHPGAEDPYFLYAASNAGSVAVLLAFPLLLEPLLATGSQSVAWSFGFAVFALAIVACGATNWRAGIGGGARIGQGGEPDGIDSAGPASTGKAEATASASREGLSWRQRAVWLAYSAVPSALLLGVTAHISTDIASAPLLWVVPLALYLLSFVNAFARRPLVPHWLAVRLMAFAIVLLAAVFLWREPAGIFLPLHLGAFFCIALACHGELARRRPAAASLTEFYLVLSLGGLAGGVCVALVAPLVFDSVLEYPLFLALAAALLPKRRMRGGGSAQRRRCGGAGQRHRPGRSDRGGGHRGRGAGRCAAHGRPGAAPTAHRLRRHARRAGDVRPVPAAAPAGLRAVHRRALGGLAAPALERRHRVGGTQLLRRLPGDGVDRARNT